MSLARGRERVVLAPTPALMISAASSAALVAARATDARAEHAPIVANYERVASAHTSAQARARSAAAGLRRYHNTCKRVLIAYAMRQLAPARVRVLNVACGRDADLLKYADEPCVNAVTALDVAAGALDEVRRRAAEQPARARVPFTTIEADMTRPWTRSYVPELTAVGTRAYALVTCFFAAHYAFGTETSARTLLANIAGALAPGGFVLVIVPSARAIADATAPGAGAVVTDVAASPPSRMYASELVCVDARTTDFDREFGARYDFSFVDAIDAVPEYLVHRRTLLRLAREQGLVLHLDDVALDALGRDATLRALLPESADVLDAAAAALDAESAAATRLYSAYVFSSLPASGPGRAIT
jgi:SAM-dependent methyltransferase